MVISVPTTKSKTKKPNSYMEFGFFIKFIEAIEEHLEVVD